MVVVVVVVVVGFTRTPPLFRGRRDSVNSPMARERPESGRHAPQMARQYQHTIPGDRRL